MKFLSIGFKNCNPDIIDDLVANINNIEDKRYKVKVMVVNNQQMSYVVCKYPEKNITISDILCNYIINNHQDEILLKIINENYLFNSLENKKVLELCHGMLYEAGDNSYYEHKQIIKDRLLEFLEVSDELIIDGFIKFRIKEYIKFLEDIADRAVDVFLAEREYQEFIKLLKYFVDMQEPKLQTVHILSGYDEKYMILDENKCEITNECIKEFVEEMPDGELNFDDFLISSLITIAPVKIYIHIENNIKNKELLKTIKSVFDNRVVICNGCGICSNIGITVGAGALT